MLNTIIKQNKDCILLQSYNPKIWDCIDKQIKQGRILVLEKKYYNNNKGDWVHLEYIRL